MKARHYSLFIISIALLSYSNFILIASDLEQKSNTQDLMIIDSPYGLYQEHTEVPPPSPRFPAKDRNKKNNYVMDCCFATTCRWCSKKETLNKLRSFIDNDENTINCSCYKDIPKEQLRDTYEFDLESMAHESWNAKGATAFRYLLELVKKKRDYPHAVGAALDALRQYKNKKQITLPIFREWAAIKSTNWKERDAKLAAARGLIEFGEIDPALQALDELAYQGEACALRDIHYYMKGKKWQNNGIAVIRKGLTYDNNETKSEAALILIELTQDGIIKEDLNNIERILLKITSDAIYNNGLVQELIREQTNPQDISYGYSLMRALEKVLLAFEKLKSKDAIPLLETLSTYPAAIYIQGSARHAIEIINK